MEKIVGGLLVGGSLRWLVRDEGVGGGMVPLGSSAQPTTTSHSLRTTSALGGVCCTSSAAWLESEVCTSVHAPFSLSCEGEVCTTVHAPTSKTGEKTVPTTLFDS